MELTKILFPDAKLLTRSNAPGIIDCVENIARKAGCSAPPVYITPHKQLNAAIYPLGQSMVLFQGALDKTGSSRHHVSPMMESIIAHEMGHWSNAWRHFGPIFGLIAGGGLVADGAVYVYDRMQKKQKEEKEKGNDIDMQAAFNKVFEEMKQKSFWENYKDYSGYHSMPGFNLIGSKETESKSWSEYLQRQMKTLAANAASFAIVLPLTRPFALRNEYEADAFAARMTSPETTIKLLDHLHEGHAAKAAKAMGDRLKNPEAAQRVSRSLGEWFQHVLSETAMAHPTWEQRVSAIRKLAPTLHGHHH